MSGEEKQPILMDSGVYVKPSGSNQFYEQSGQQHIIIQPIEFDHKHRNAYGYLALIAFILVLVNYLMIKERSCQVSLANGLQDFELIQGFHMTVLIVGIIVFILSYFNFAVVIYEVKPLFYASAALIFVCAGLLIYNVVAISTAPCLSPGFGNVLPVFGLTSLQSKNVFSAGDGIGIAVFILDIFAVVALFIAGRSFYKRS